MFFLVFVFFFTATAPTELSTALNTLSLHDALPILEKKLKPALFSDEEEGGAPRKSPVSKAKRSERGELKVASKVNEDGLPVHSFSTMLEDLQTLARITVRPKVSGAKTFNKLAEATSVQKKILRLLDIQLKEIPSCSQ